VGGGRRAKREVTHYYKNDIPPLERPRSDLFLGVPKTGKTTFAVEVVQAFVDEHFSVVEDEEGWWLKGYTVVAYDPNKYYRRFYVKGHGYLQASRYRPGSIESGGPLMSCRDLEPVLQEMIALQRADEKINCVLVIDELLQIPKKLHNLIRIISSNRRHDMVWIFACSQRAAHIPTELLWLANHVYCFKLKDPKDHKHLEGITTKSIELFSKGEFELCVLNDA